MNPLHVATISSEMVPLAKTGGLGDMKWIHRINRLPNSDGLVLVFDGVKSIRSVFQVY